MIKVYIDNVEYKPEYPYDFVIDGTEVYNTGSFKLTNLSQKTPFKDYADIIIDLNGTDIEMQRKTDVSGRTSKNIYAHDIQIEEVVKRLEDVQIPDRAFDTYNGNRVTYKYIIQTYITTSDLDYTIATETQTLLNSTADFKQFVGQNFLQVLVECMRPFGAVPTLTLDNVIGHRKLDFKNNDISTQVSTVLENDAVENRVAIYDNNDYAESLYYKVKNGSNVGVMSFFPSKTSYVTPRSSDNTYDDATSQIQFDSNIKQIVSAKVKVNASAQIITNKGTFGSGGDLPSPNLTGAQYTCDTDGYYSAAADLTFNNGDKAVFVYNKWFKNIIELQEVEIIIDVTAFVKSKEEWDKLTISSDNTELLNGFYQNNTLYYQDNLVLNIGTTYDSKLSTLFTYTPLRKIFNIIEEWDAQLNIATAKVQESEWQFRYYPERDYDTIIKRLPNSRVERKIVKSNTQKDSNIDIYRLGESAYQQVNRMGNDHFTITLEYRDDTSYWELYDYYDAYKIVKIKYQVLGVDNMLVTYDFVKNFAPLNPYESRTTPTSPYSIQSKQSVNTCFVREYLLEFSDTNKVDDANETTLKRILLNRFDYSSTYDTPIYNVAYYNPDLTYLTGMSVLRAIEGRAFMFNAQFNNKVLAGYGIEDGSGFIDFSHVLKGVPYTDADGEVETYKMYYCNEVDANAEDFPKITSYTPLFGNFTRTSRINPNEILGETFKIHCTSDKENFYIYKPFLENNSIIDEILGGINSPKIYYYVNPIFTYNTTEIPTETLSSTPTITTSKIEFNPVVEGLSWCLVDETTDEIYFAYNNYGEEFTTIYFNLLKGGNI